MKNYTVYLVTLVAMISITTGLNAREWVNVINNARTALLTEARSGNLDGARGLAGQFLNLAREAVEARAYGNWMTDPANQEIMPILDEVFNARRIAEQEAERRAFEEYARGGPMGAHVRGIVEYLRNLTEDDIIRLR